MRMLLKNDNYKIIIDQVVHWGYFHILLYICQMKVYIRPQNGRLTLSYTDHHSSNSFEIMRIFSSTGEDDSG